MPLFEQSIAIDEERLKELVLNHWNINIGKCIKASQNHTFEAYSPESEELSSKYIVRVTPIVKKDAESGLTFNRILNEIEFILYLKEHDLPVCGPICRNDMTKDISLPPSLSPDNFVLFADDSIIIVCFEYAKGECVNYAEWKWMTDENMIKALGYFMANLHHLSRLFKKERPKSFLKFRIWDELHDGVMKGVELDKQDALYISEMDSNKVGLLHGDINPSNYFFIPESNTLCVFDWDQTMRGWYTYDIAQAIFGVVLVESAGNPTSGGSPVPEADPKRFTKILLEAYEEISGKDSIDKEEVQRMVDLKKLFYIRFCRRGLVELEESGTGEKMSHMLAFLHFIVDWADKEEEKEEKRKES